MEGTLGPEHGGSSSAAYVPRNGARSQLKLPARLPHETGDLGPRSGLKEDRWQKGCTRLVVQADAHEGQRLSDPQTLFEAPPEKLGIASW